MATFGYKALELKTKKRTTGIIEAENSNRAIELIKSLGLEPIEVVEKKSSALGDIKGGRLTTKDRVIFSRQLSTMISAGVPLMTALVNIGNQNKKPAMNNLISNLRDNIAGGASFSDSLQRYPNFFNKTYVNLVYAGEQSGRLDTSLHRLADQQQREEELQKKVMGALFYPAIILFAIFGVIIFMMLLVIPSIRSIYEDIGGGFENLPLITRMLINTSDAFVNYWYFILIGLGAVVAYLIWAWRTKIGKRYLDKTILKIPILGSFMNKLYMAQFCRRIELLVVGGISYVQSLTIIGDGFSNHLMSEAIEEAIEEVKSGRLLSDALLKQPLFLDLVPSMIKIGEESGTLDEMLGRAAEYYEKEVEQQIEVITTLIQPVLIIVVGGIAGLIILAVLWPIYQLANEQDLNVTNVGNLITGSG